MRGFVTRQKKAPLPGAFFIWVLLSVFGLGLCLSSGQVAASEPCPADRIDETVKVSYVNDGDTVRLADGRRVRLIGLDTPEIGRDGQPDEPFAQGARRKLEQLVRENDQRLALRFDAESQDRHGRLLAHAFLPDGRSVARLMLEDGLAAQVFIPPNLWNKDCLRPVEERARRRGIGIWSLPEFARGLDAQAMPASVRGMALVRGRVESIGRSRQAGWINLEGGVSLRIDDRDLPLFAGQDFDRLKGRSVEARGWINPQGGQRKGWRMSLRHPDALRTLD